MMARVRDVGYLHIGGFRDLEVSTQAIDTTVDVFEGARGIIVDVRHNGGG